MRAAVVRDGRMVVETRPDPAPGAGEVLVRVRRCGICGSDLHYVHHAREIIALAGSLGAPTQDMERTLAGGPVLGHEFVCEIVDFGADTTRTLKRGAAVCSMPFVLRGGAPVLIGSTLETPGAFAEYMTLTEALLLPVPEGVDDDAAALTEPVGIAVHAVAKSEIGADDVAIIVGCGPIGLAIIAVLKARGVHRIVASDLSPKRRDLAGQIGASIVVDGARDSVFATAATAHPGGRTMVFENTGARGMIHRIVVEAPQNARVIVTGIPPAEESFVPMAAIMKEIELRFVIYYTPAEFAEALALVARGAIPANLLVTGRVGLAGVEQAFHDLQDPERHAKIVVDPWAP